MRYAVLFTSALALLLSPAAATAHMEDVDPNAPAGFMMMQQLEDEAIGDDATHEEMEELMVKMMTGSMTEAEAQRMVTLMDEFPSAGSMMMNRMMGGSAEFGMMGGLANAPWNISPTWVFWITILLVWLFLLSGIGFFGQRIQKK